MGKRLLSLFVSVCILIVNAINCFAIPDEYITSGKCGENVFWSYDINDRILTFYGTGNMYDIWVLEGAPSIFGVDSVIVEYGVTSIAQQALRWSVSNVSISNSVKRIEQFAFVDCPIENLHIPDSVTYIGYGAFCYSQIRNLQLGEGITYIGEKAFCGNHLNSVYINKNVMYVGEEAFSGGFLQEISVDINNSNYCSINGSLYSKDKTHLYQYATGRSDNTYVIPNNVRIIGKSAFMTSDNLTYVSIPKSVTAIGEYAFASCNNLTDIYYDGTKEEWDNIIKGDGYLNFTDVEIHFSEKNLSTKYRSDLIENQDNATISFDYSDNYFINTTGYDYNHDLARASLALELSSWTPKNADDDRTATAGDRMANIYDLYSKLGFDTDSIYQQNYGKALSDNSDSVAYSFATKPLSDGSNLVAVVVRGGGYGAEWRSNLHVGTGSKHAGFSIPGQEVYNNLDIYISANNLDRENTKIWITGYSRGAAVANIVAGQINETGLINSNNLYAYTFATPNGVKVAETGADSSVHDNIYNIVLPYDFVPKVAMENWGYGRYGQTLMVKNSDTTPAGYTMDEHMPHERYFLNYTSKRYSVEKSQTKAANHLKNTLSVFGKNQEYFVNNYEGLIMDIIEWAMYRKGAKGENLTEFVFERYGSHENFSDALGHAYPYMSNYSNFSMLYKLGLDSSMVYSIVALMYMNGIEMSEDETIDFIVNELGNILNEIGVFSAGKMISDGMKLFDPKESPHNPEYYISWLYAYDNPKNIYERSTYKKLTVACPVNVNVYDSAGTLVASVVDNKVVVDTLPIDIIGESAEIYFYEGEDIDDYTIEIEAYDEGNVNYSVTEYENSGVETRKINYANIPVSTGTKLSGNVPKGQSLDAEVYNLTSITDEEETTIAFTEDLTNEDLQNLTVDVTVEGDGVANDVYFATKGELVILNAQPYFDATFIGWYDEKGNLLSESADYSFVLHQELNVIAKFTKCTVKTFFVTIPQTSEGTLSLDCSIVAGKDIDGKLYVALYGETGAFLDVKLIDVLVGADNEGIYTTAFDISKLKETPKTVKLFLFKNTVPISIATSSGIISV